MRPVNIAMFGVLAIILVLAGFVAKDRFRVLASSERHAAVVVECDSKTGRSKRKRGGWTNTRSYAPVAVSGEGYQAKGSLWVSSKSLCNRMVGRDVTIYVDRNNPNATRMGGFFQFWLFPIAAILITVFVLACIARFTKMATGTFVTLIAVFGSAFLLEFRLFSGEVEPGSSAPVVDSKLGFASMRSPCNAT